MFASKVLTYFIVDGIEAEHARLVEAGVTFNGEPHPVRRDASGELWMAGFTDPDGHHPVLMRQR